MCFTRHPICRSHFYGVKWRVRSARTEENQALRCPAPKSEVNNNYLYLEKHIYSAIPLETVTKKRRQESRQEAKIIGFRPDCQLKVAFESKLLNFLLRLSAKSCV